MWDPQENWAQQGSFIEPVPPPEVEPDADPLVCVSFNASWLPYVLGCLQQLMQPTSWATTDPDVLSLAQSRTTDLISRVGTSGACEPMIMLQGADCELQQSLDGGTTWTVVPGWDDSIVPCFLPSSYTPPPQTSLRMDGCDLQFTLDGGSSWVSTPGWADSLGFCFALPAICYAWGSYGSGPLGTDWAFGTQPTSPEAFWNGTAWQSIAYADGGGTYTYECAIDISFSILTALHVEVDGFLEGGGDISDRYVQDSSSTFYALPFAAGPFTASVDIAATTSLRISLRTRVVSVNTLHNFLYGVRIHATGINPWGTSNCT